MIESRHWTATGFAQLDLSDARLDKRARMLMERFAADPTASIPMAGDGRSETIAAYGFLDKEEADWRDIMAPHW